MARAENYERSRRQRFTCILKPMKPKAKYDWSTKRWAASTELTEAELGLKGLAGLEATIRAAMPADEPLPKPTYHSSGNIVPMTTIATYNQLAAMGNQAWSLQPALNMQNCAQQGGLYQQQASAFGALDGLGLGAIFGR